MPINARLAAAGVALKAGNAKISSLPPTMFALFILRITSAAVARPPTISRPFCSDRMKSTHGGFAVRGRICSTSPKRARVSLARVTAFSSAPSNFRSFRSSLKEQPDGVRDDVARRHGVSLRVVLDLLPGPAARSASGARFVDIWGDLVDWGPVTFIVHTEDGVFETKAPLPPGNEARGYFNIHGESPLGGHLRIARCAAI